jgi:HSP20 family protein
VKQQDVDVSIHGHTMTIRSQRHEDSGKDGDHWVMQEYGSGSWERSMTLPQEVESGAVTARYEDGILELRLPKAGPESRRNVPIAGPNHAAPDGENPRPDGAGHDGHNGRHD